MATADERHKELMGAITSQNIKIDNLEETLLKRAHLDDMIKSNYEFINGNGKPGAKSQINTLLWWNRTVIVILIINILSNWMSM